MLKVKLEIDAEFIQSPIYYQPIVSLVTGKICGAEALVRWKTKEDKIIPPSEFIPIAEEADFITDFTVEAISAVFRDLPQINQVDNSIWVSFNTSAKDFTNSRVADCISQEMANFKLSHGRVHLEITETAFLPLNPQTKQAIFDIHDLGIEIVLNDFTAGYSTFDYLSKLPFSSLKIAMPLTKRTPISRMDWKLFRHLVSLGHQLRYDVIAEGVENDELHELILSTGCTSAQGYYYSHPVPLDDFIALLKQSKTWVNFPYGLMYLAQYDHIDFRRDIIREALFIYNNSDKQLRKRARTRVPDTAFAEERFREWFSKVKEINLESASGRNGYEKNYVLFYKSCSELLQLADEQVAWNIFDAKYREIIELSAKLTQSLIDLSSECLVRSYQRNNVSKIDNSG